MKQFMPSFAVALILIASMMSAQAAPIITDVDPWRYPEGTTFDTQFAGVFFSLTDDNDVVVGAPVRNGPRIQSTIGLIGIPNMVVDYARAASNVSIDYFAVEGLPYSSDDISYQAWNSGGNVIAFGSLAGPGTMNLPDGVIKIEFSTHHPNPWNVSLPLYIYSLHAEFASLPAVPEPATMTMLLSGLALLGVIRRKKNLK